MEDCDRGVIETALASPAAGFGDHEEYPTLASKAAVLTYTLAKSQACTDGNKRITLILLRELLAQNGAGLQAQVGEAAEMILFAAASERDERDDVIERLAEWLGAATVPLPSEEVP